MTGPPPAPASPSLGWSLMTLSRAYHHQLGATLADLPQGPRGYHTLAAVVQGQDPCQLELATSLGIDKTVMTYLIDDLVAHGLVQRRPNPRDRRQRLIEATPTGRQLLATVQARVRSAEDHFLAALTDTERTQLRDLLARVSANLTTPTVGDPESGAGCGQ
jgi:DNA-binding MarR family transcriptional regulator